MGCASSKTINVESKELMKTESTRGESGTPLTLGRTQRVYKTRDTAIKQDGEELVEGRLSEREIQLRQSKSLPGRSLQLNESVTLRYAFVSQRGYYPDDKNKPNQDAWSIYTQWGGLDQDAFFGVFDGHGPYGHDCANFAKKNLPNVVCKYVRSSRLRLHTSTPPPCTSPASRQSSISSRRSWRSSIADEEEKLPESLDDDLVIMPVSKTLASNVPKKTWDPKSWPMLSQVMLEECLRLGHIECNQSMHVAESVKDRVSGTTAISAVFHNNLMTISNVGDSRAILGRRVAQTVDQDRLPQVLEHLVPQVPEQERAPVTAKLFSRDSSRLTDSPLDLQVTTLQAIGLSVDQTPYRKDELERVKAAGARVLSLDQLEGVEPHHENWPCLEAGVDIDVEGDPPRVWVPNGDYPGTAFTRSLGDSEADAIGVIAEPEINTLSLTPDDKILILASDGVFEFLPNQDVIDICSQYTDPLDAAEAVVRAAYDLWFSYELRTDDITIIVVFLDWHNDKDIAPRVPRPLLMESKKGDVSSLKTMENNESHKAVELCAASPGYFKSNVEKSMLQVEFLLHILDVTPSFQNMTEIQRELIIHAMEPLNVSAGHILLQQGEVGDHFYVLEGGQVSVRVSKLDVVGDVVVHTLSGSAQTFGEVALIQSIPSSHSLVAETDSRLWKLTRSAFQTVRSEISSNHKRVLFYMLLQLPQLHLLNPVHLWKLVKHMDSVTFDDGQVIFNKDAPADYFYSITKGTCVASGGGPFDGRTYFESQHVGDECLTATDCSVYDHTITATSEMLCMRLSHVTIKKFLNFVNPKVVRKRAQSIQQDFYE